MSPSDDALAPLRAVLDPSVEPDSEPLPVAWEMVEEELGLVLPTDYKQFIAAYGSGEIDRFLLVLSPFAQDPGLHLGKQTDLILSIVREFRDLGEYVPYPLFPEPEGLLPWAGTRNGDSCYWYTRGEEPEGWRVVVGTRYLEWEEFPCSMTGFLADVLTRRLQVSLFPENFPSSKPTFSA